MSSSLTVLCWPFLGLFLSFFAYKNSFLHYFVHYSSFISLLFFYLILLILFVLSCLHSTYCIPVRFHASPSPVWGRSLPFAHLVLARVLLCSICPYTYPTFSTCSVLITLMVEAVSSYEMSASIYHTTQCNMSEDNHLHTCHCENVKYRDKLPGTDQIPAELSQATHYILKSTKLLILFAIRKNYQRSGRNLVLYLFIRRVIKQTSNYWKTYYHLHTKFYPALFPQPELA